MKILHVPFGFYPDPVGGTEILCEFLAHELERLNVEVVIAAPATEDTAYAHNMLRVRRYAVNQNTVDVREIYGHGDPLAAQNFRKLLCEETPDLVHLHAFTSGISLDIVREAKKRGLPVIFTYHTPTVTCTRGTLMRWGTEVCDGHMDGRLCTQCTLMKMGLSKFGSWILSAIPAGVGQALGDMKFRGDAWTAMRMSELITLRHNAARSLLDEVDRIVVLCDWSKELLVQNGIPQSKIVLVRQAIHGWQDTIDTPTSPFHEGGRLRIVYIGRIDPTKGIHLLIKALQLMPTAPIELDIYGVLQPGNDRYAQEIARLVDVSPYMRFLPSIPNDQIIPMLSKYHLLAVPSQCLEVAPLVILEAFRSQDTCDRFGPRGNCRNGARWTEWNIGSSDSSGSLGADTASLYRATRIMG